MQKYPPSVSVGASHSHQPPYRRLHQSLCRVATALIVGLCMSVSVSQAASHAQVSHAQNYSLQSNSLQSNSAQAGQDAAGQVTMGANKAHQTPSAIRQELVEIITSGDYAESKTRKSWQAIEKPARPKEHESSWWVKLIQWLFGSQAESGTAAIFSLLLKGLLVLALIVFIVWVVRRAGYLQGWAGKMPSRLSRSSRMEPYNPESLSQRWQALPAHEQIPAVVAAQLQQGELTTAASILYRGSLRWLMRSQQLTIAPAMTEKQCLAQIKQLNESGQYHYISGIIQLWVQAAYDSTAALPASPTAASTDTTATSANHRTNLAAKLSAVTSHWLAELRPFEPISASTERHLSDPTSEATHAK